MSMAAKDGSNRGGARPGAGAKKKSLVDKIAEGSANATMLSFPEPAELTGLKMPSPSKFLSASCPLNNEMVPKPKLRKFTKKPGAG